MSFNGIKKVGINKYRLDIHVRVKGQELRKRVICQGSKTEAEESFVKIKKELLNFSDNSGDVFKTVGEVLEYYETARPKGPIPECDYGRFKRIHNHFCDVLVVDLPDRLAEYVLNVRNNSSPYTGKSVSNGTVNKNVGVIKAAINLAVQDEKLKESPLSKKRFKKLKEKPRDTVLTEEQIQKLIEVINVEAPHLEFIVRFALKVPCRKSELLRMKREDLDLGNMSIRVINTKAGRRCLKPIPPELIEYFQNIPSDCPFLFYRVEKGEYRPLGDFKKSWMRCLKLAGINDFRFHDTRHISATNMINNGTPSYVVRQIADWSTDILSDYYHRDSVASLELVKFG